MMWSKTKQFRQLGRVYTQRKIMTARPDSASTGGVTLVPDRGWFMEGVETLCISRDPYETGWEGANVTHLASGYKVNTGAMDLETACMVMDELLALPIPWAEHAKAVVAYMDRAPEDVLMAMAELRKIMKGKMLNTTGEHHPRQPDQLVTER